jgi:hypothetical protein
VAAHDHDPPAKHSPLIEFPEALEVFFTRIDELKRVVGPAHAPAVDQVAETLREALAARARGDMPGAMGRIMQAMQHLSSVVSGAIPDEGPLMQAMAAQFQQALSRGSVPDAKQAAEVMRVNSGSTLYPKKDPK